MQKLSEHLIALISKLYEKPTFWQRLGNGDDSRVAIIHELAESGNASVVLSLTALLFQGGEVETATVQAIEKLLANATGDVLLDLDERLRSIDGSWGAADWWKVTPRDVRRLSVPANSAGTIFGVLSSHPNGRVREAAVRKLDAISDGSEMPYLLMRLNDWVAPIHNLSRAAIEDRIRRRRFADFFRWVELVFWLAGCRRYNHSDLLQVVVEQLTAEENAKALFAALASDSRFARRSTYRAVISAGASDVPRVILPVLRSNDSVLRLWATRDARVHLADDDLRRLLPRLLADRFVPVRREALLCKIERFADEACEALECALLDSSASMRDFARYYLRRLSDVDFAKFYRTRLDEPDRQLVVIAGLGETGTPDDVPRLVGFLSDNRTRIRAAAVHGIGRLSQSITSDLLRVISDDHKRVTDEACRAVARHIDSVSLESLAQIYRTETRRHVLINLIQLIDLKDSWEALPHLIEACASNEPDVAVVAKQRIYARFNHLYTTPTSDQRERVLRAIERLSSTNAAAFAAEVENWLGLRR